MIWLRNFFKPVSAAAILTEQLEDAQRQRAVHIAAAEHHAALAGMYQGRVERIRREQAAGQHAELRAVK